MKTKISKHAKDIIQKYASGLFRNATLEFYGLKTARIKEMVNVELPAVEVSTRAADDVFLLEDDSYLHYEFETGCEAGDFPRYADYDIRLYKRDGRRVHTVVIYIAADTIRLAQTIPDETKRNACVAAAFAFANRYLSDDDVKNLLEEVLKLTDIASILVEDAVNGAKKEIGIEIAKKLLKRGMSVEAIAEDTGLDEVTIRQLQAS